MRSILNGKLLPQPPSGNLNKPNDSLVMVPKVGRLNATMRKMFNLLLHSTQTQILEMRNQGKLVLGETLFKTRFHDLVDRTTDSGSDARASAKKYLLEMRRTEVDWEAPDADSNIIWANMGLLSQVELEKRGNEIWVNWALPPALLRAISDPVRYTPIDTNILSKLHSYSAIALYEVCVRYKNNPTHLTSRNPTSWWIDALKSTASEFDKTTKQVKRPEWRKFKNEQVIKAVIEINQNTDLTIELTEFKTHRAIDFVQFSVHKKGTNTDDAKPAKLIANVVLAEQASRIGLSYKQLQKSFSEGFSDQRIAYALSHLESRIKRSDLSPISSIDGYFRRLLTEGVSETTQVDFVDQFKSMTNPTEIHAQSDALQTESKKLPDSQPLPLFQEPEWVVERIARISSDLSTLDEAQEKRYLLLVEESLKERGIYGPTMAQGILNRKWQKGRLLSEMINVYGVEKYGPHWKTQH